MNNMILKKVVHLSQTLSVVSNVSLRSELFWIDKERIVRE